MKKAEMVDDDIRPQYRREDCGPMVHGKWAHLKESYNIIVLDPNRRSFPERKSRQ